VLLERDARALAHLPVPADAPVMRRQAVDDVVEAIAIDVEDVGLPYARPESRIWPAAKGVGMESPRPFRTGRGLGEPSSISDDLGQSVAIQVSEAAASVAAGRTGFRLTRIHNIVYLPRFARVGARLGPIEAPAVATKQIGAPIAV